MWNLCELQKYALQESIMNVFQFDGTSSVWVQSLAY